MMDINLHQASEHDLKINKKQSILKSGTFLSFALLLVVGTVYLGTKIYQQYLLKEKKQLIEEKKAETSSFDVEMAGNLADFNQRLTDTSYNLKNKTVPGNILKSIEELMVKGVYLDNLTYDKMSNKLVLGVLADSFRLASSQMLSLKNSGLFEDVKITDSSRVSGENDTELARIELTLHYVQKKADKK